MKVYLTIEEDFGNYYLTKNESIINYNYDCEEEYDETQYSYVDEFELVFVSEEYYTKKNGLYNTYIIVKNYDEEYVYFRQTEYQNGTFVNFIEAEEFFAALSEDDLEDITELNDDEINAYLIALALCK